MLLNTEKITAAIAKINSETSETASALHVSGVQINRIKPFISSFIKFLSSFFGNENKYRFRNRLFNACLLSFSELLKNLKLLRLNNKF